VRRAFVLALAGLQLLLLAGKGGVRGNYRELEQLLVIQTMGVDARANGLTLALAAKGDARQGVKRMKAAGSSLTAAMERIRLESFEEELFCAHIGQLLVGEKAAEAGLEDLLADLARAPDLRLDLPLYVIREDTAERAVMQVGDDSRGICDVMDTVRQTGRRRAGCRETAAKDILADSERFGAALICALRLTPAAEQEGEPGTDAPLTAALEGYGILRDGKLCRYLTAEQAVAVSFLKDETAAAEGQLTGLKIDAETSAAVVEQGAGGDESYSDMLCARLEEYLARELESVLRVSRELKADFLGLSAQVERADPVAYQALSRDFSELLPELELEITVRARLRHVNDRKEG